MSSEIYVNMISEFGNPCKCSLDRIEFKLRQGAQLADAEAEKAYEEYKKSIAPVVAPAPVEVDDRPVFDDEEVQSKKKK